METRDDSLSSLSSETDVDQADEYYEEVDNHTLNFQKRKAPTPSPILTPIPTKSVVQKSVPVVDPIQKLNEQLNRQFRPDLAPPSPSPSPPPPPPPPPISSKAIVKRTPLSPDPLIFDARAKPIKTLKKKKEPSVSVTQKLFSRTHHLTEPTSQSKMSYQQTTTDGFQVPPGMMLVPAPQQQQPTYQTVSEYKPPTVTNSNSFKHNKVAPPPSFSYNNRTSNHVLHNNAFQSPSSMVSTNNLIQSSYALKQQPQQQQHLFKHIDQSKSNKKKQKKQSIDDVTDVKNTNRSYALYNQRNGRIEGVVKNRLNVATDDAHESKIVDEETEPKGEWALWLSQPLCLGLTRLSGGLLFGSMVLLACASIGGLIASIILYSSDSVTDAQWKILGMVVCAIMLITIIITLLVFVCCYKQGYMFDRDDDTDPTDPSTTQDAEGNERQKAVLRKIYKFNRPNDTPPISSNILQNVSTSPPPVPQRSIQVNDKQTNTETTIAPLRPKDFDRGVWPSLNAYGGISYRPLMQPQMVSRFIQVLPHEIENALHPPPPQIIYQVVAPAAAVQSSQMQPGIYQIPTQQTQVVEYMETSQKQPRMIQIPAQQNQLVEYIETSQKQPRVIQIPAQQNQFVEYIETSQKQPRVIQIPAQQDQLVEYMEAPQKQPRTIQIPAQQNQLVEYMEAPQKHPRTIQIPAQQNQVVEYIEASQKQPRRTIIHQPQTQQYVVQPSTRIEYVDADQQRTRHIVQQPQYEIVEEVTEQSTVSRTEDYVEVVDAPKHGRHRRKKKEKKQAFGKVSVKHIKSADD